MSLKKFTNNKLFVYFILILVAFFTRYYLFEDRNSWHDEWHSIYVADPDISNDETFLRYYGNKGDSFLTEFYPPLYLFILKFFFKVFGYIDDYGRVLSLIFGVITIPLSMLLTEYLDKGKKFIITGIIVSFNLFLIWQSIEIRAHSILVAFSLLNIILFFKILDEKKPFLLFSYFSCSLFLLSLWPIAGAIFFGKTIYLLKDFILNRNKNTEIFILFIVILILYIFFNFDYLKFNLSRDYHYTSLYKSFFYNYHFRSFFGSIYLGAIFLISFFLLTIKNFKKIIFKNDKSNLLFYIIFSSYFLTLLYTIFRASLMSPKYVIFIIPLIIIWIFVELPKAKYHFLKMLYLITTILFFISNINYSPIDRPPTKILLEELIKNKIQVIVTVESDVFNNYLKTKKLVKKNNIKVIKYNQDIPDDFDKYWFVCLNNVLHVVGEKGLISKNPKVESKCVNFKSNYNFVEQFPSIINIQDFYIRKFQKN